MPRSRKPPEGEEEPRGSSAAGSQGGRAKRKSKPTGKARARKQRTKDRYAHAREDAQLEGLIPTTPEEALKDERVDPAAQGDAPQPALVGEAIRRGWAVPDGLKPHLVDELVGIIMDPAARTKDKVAAFNALRGADRSQWEQDNPVDAGKAKGASTAVAISVESNMLAVKVIREKLISDVGGGDLLLSPLAVAGAPGDSRFDGEVECGAASTGDEQDAGEGMAHGEQPDHDYGPIPAR